MNDTEKKGWKRVSIVFNEDIQAMVTRFQTEKGFDTVSEVVKQAVRVMYAKEFPNYVEAKRAVPKSPEEKADYERRKREQNEKEEEERYLKIVEALGGTVRTNDGGNKVCVWYTYDKKNRYENELPLTFLTEDLIASQYSPSKEDIEKRQKEGKVNY